MHDLIPCVAFDRIRRIPALFLHHIDTLSIFKRGTGTHTQHCAHAYIKLCLQFSFYTSFDVLTWVEKFIQYLRLLWFDDVEAIRMKRTKHAPKGEDDGKEEKISAQFSFSTDRHISMRKIHS